MTTNAQQLFVVPRNRTPVRVPSWDDFKGANGLMPEWYGAVGDGVHDDTDAFQKIAGQGGNLVIVLSPGKTYICNAVIFESNVLIYSLGNAIVKRSLTDGLNGVFRFIGANTIVRLFNFTIDGGYIKKNGIVASDLEEFIAIGMRVQFCGIPGYAAGNRTAVDGLSIARINYTHIERCKFLYCERDGILSWPSNHFIAINNYAEGCGRGGLVCDRNQVPPTGGAVKVIIANNEIRACGAIGCYAEGTSIVPMDVDIHDNLVIDCGADDWGFGYGVVAGNNARGKIHSNTIINFGQGGTAADAHAIVVGNYSGDLIINNNVVLNPRNYGIVINNVVVDNNHVVGITNNIIRQAGKWGIYCYQAPRTLITDNQIWASQLDGIIINLSNTCQIKDNVIRDSSSIGSNQYSGVSIVDSIALVIVDNDINGANQKYGISNTNSTGTVPTISNIRDNRITTFVTAAVQSFTAATTLAGYDQRVIVGNFAVDDGVYKTKEISSDTNVGFTTRPVAGVNNILQRLIGSTDNLASGVIWNYYSDQAGVSTRRHVFNFHKDGISILNDALVRIFYVDVTDKVLQLTSITKAQRNAITASNGMIARISDGPNPGLQEYRGGAWGVLNWTADP
jgi:hypothetical protein